MANCIHGISRLRKCEDCEAGNPVATEGLMARRSAATCSPEFLQVKDAFAVEVFVADYSGERYTGSNFLNVENARAWLQKQPNRDSLRVAIAAKFILENK